MDTFNSEPDDVSRYHASRLLEAFFDEEPIPVDIEAGVAFFAAKMAKI